MHFVVHSEKAANVITFSNNPEGRTVLIILIIRLREGGDQAWLGLINQQTATLKIKENTGVHQH